MRHFVRKVVGILSHKAFLFTLKPMPRVMFKVTRAKGPFSQQGGILCRTETFSRSQVCLVPSTIPLSLIQTTRPGRVICFMAKHFLLTILQYGNGHLC